jgi:hypothetical protein
MLELAGDVTGRLILDAGCGAGPLFSDRGEAERARDAVRRECASIVNENQRHLTRAFPKKHPISAGSCRLPPALSVVAAYRPRAPSASNPRSIGKACSWWPSRPITVSAWHRAFRAASVAASTTASKTTSNGEP